MATHPDSNPFPRCLPLVLPPMIDSPFRDFPVDITRTIFEDASRTCRKTALKLILLSSAVRRWIEPIIYYDVSLLSEISVWAFMRSAIVRNDNAFFARTVRKLKIYMGFTQEAEHTIALCLRLVSLNIVNASSITHVPEIPDMRHLHTLKALTITEPPPLLSNVNNFPPNITHLRLLSVRQSMSNTSYLREILHRRPSIIYLMFGLGLVAFNYMPLSAEALTIWRHLQSDPCHHLRLLVVLSGPLIVGLGESQWQENVEAVERLSTMMQEMESRTVVVNSDRQFFGVVKNVLDMDFDEEDIWDKAEEYLVECGRLEKGSWFSE